MSKRVLDVGQCGLDHPAIRRMIERSFPGVQVVQADDAEEALDSLHGAEFSLVLVNRQLHADGSDGLELIRRIKADPQAAQVPVMLVSNYPQYQQKAVAIGALPGFGKAELGDPATIEKIHAVLERVASGNSRHPG